MKPYIIVLKYQSTSIGKCSDKTVLVYILSPDTACPPWLMLYMVFLSAKDNYLCALFAPFLSIHCWLCVCCVRRAHTCELWKQTIASCVIVGVLLLCDLRIRQQTVSVPPPPPPLWSEMPNVKVVCNSLTIADEMCRPPGMSLYL